MLSFRQKCFAIGISFLIAYAVFIAANIFEYTLRSYGFSQKWYFGSWFTISFDFGGATNYPLQFVSVNSLLRFFISTGCAIFIYEILKAGMLAKVDYPQCSRCRHILKGLSEPRCPECGEPI